ncbi:hypothetical protein [Brevibacterium album]|uniref:hypothetical protein n=1 Tax=Brevibacterium album TaxID=417948 RepID=UPI00041371AD|nr:hypothetical protein [Brevibacterium album]
MRWLDGFAGTFIRRYIRADLDPGDRFVEPYPFGPTHFRPEEFLRAGRAGRAAGIVVRAICLVVGLAGTAVLMPILLHALSTRAFHPAMPGLAALLVAFAGLALGSQAYLRWMLRTMRGL